jgi:hypothetical protein
MAHGDMLKRQLAAILVFLATGAAIIAAGITLQSAHPQSTHPHGGPAISQAAASDS